MWHEFWGTTGRAVDNMRHRRHQYALRVRWNVGGGQVTGVRHAGKDHAVDGVVDLERGDGGSLGILEKLAF